jgi:hypothetical protein
VALLYTVGLIIVSEAFPSRLSKRPLTITGGQKQFEFNSIEDTIKQGNLTQVEGSVQLTF